MAKGRNGKRFALSEDVFLRITDILNELVSKTRARAVIFADGNGHLIAQRGETIGYDASALCAVAAGEFSATSELARMVGENDAFRFLYHEGTETNVYISRVLQDFLLIVIFDQTVALGMVRVFTKRGIEKLGEALEKTATEPLAEEAFLDVEFSSLLGRELDKSLGD